MFNELIVWVGIFLGGLAIERIILEATETSSCQNIFLWLILSCVSVMILLYLLVKLDWNKIIGKRFPWTISTKLMEGEVDKKKAG